MDFKIPIELYTNFNDIIYYDEPHKYYVKDEQYISVTTLIHKYQEPFDEDYWSEFKANEYALTKEEVLRAWRFINRKGTMKGSIIHDYVENLLLNKIFKYPKNDIIKEFGFDPILKEYEITKNHVNNFYEVSKNKLIPVKTELVVYDKIAKIAGMLDILFYNVTAGEFQIWDNKTNKKLTTENKEQRLKGDLCLLEDCDLEIYSLQLQLYKKLIERNTSIKLGKSYIIWFSHNNEDFKIIECKDREYYVNQIIDNRIKELQN